MLFLLRTTIMVRILIYCSFKEQSFSQRTTLQPEIIVLMVGYNLNVS